MGKQDRGIPNRTQLVRLEDMCPVVSMLLVQPFDVSKRLLSSFIHVYVPKPADGELLDALQDSPINAHFMAVKVVLVETTNR